MHTDSHQSDWENPDEAAAPRSTRWIHPAKLRHSPNADTPQSNLNPLDSAPEPPS